MAPHTAINATPVLAPLTGIGTYVRELGAALSDMGADLYSFYGTHWRRGPPHPPPPGRPSGSAGLRARARQLIPFARQIRRTQQRIVFAGGVRRHGIGLYHEPNYVPLATDLPLVVTIHDLSWIRHPETHPADRVRWLEHGVPPGLARAGAILVDSGFIADELIATFALERSRVHVAPLGVGAQFHPRDSGKTRASLARLGLEHGGYVLCLATLEPRKNIEHVLVAHALLPPAVRARFPLVVAGAPGWKSGALEQRLADLAGRGELRYPGFVPPAVLPDLYAGAAAFVFPSFYEGFGLPPLEAMASGAPTLVANCAALPEVAGNGAVIVDPNDPERTAEVLRALLEDPAGREALADRGVARARGYTWRECARLTQRAYSQALG